MISADISLQTGQPSSGLSFLEHLSFLAAFSGLEKSLVISGVRQNKQESVSGVEAPCFVSASAEVPFCFPLVIPPVPWPHVLGVPRPFSAGHSGSRASAAHARLRLTP